MDLQTLIHHVEVGAGTRLFSRWLRVGLAIGGVILLAVFYDLRAFRNMSTQEAMDAAQVARNVAEGNGYTTLFVRPFSLYLLKQKAQVVARGQGPRDASADPGCLRGMHPDIANPPGYPVILAGLMKTLPFNYAISRKPKVFWGGGLRFLRYQPDFLIALFNQLLFVGVVVLVFFLSRRLFDVGIARLSAVLLLGSELFWRFSVSGISTMLLLLIYLGLAWNVVLLEQEAREPKLKRFGIFFLAGLAGLLVGLGGLTRYSFAWLILPVAGFVLLFAGKQRVALTLTTLLVFSAVLTPWLIRNYSVSGLPFGTATYTVLETSAAFPEDRLQRSIDPGFGPGGPFSHRVVSAFWHAFWQKLVSDGRQIVRADLPKLGGTWLSAFFLVGLLIQFRNPGVRRLRYFLLACLVVLAVVQAVGHTQLSEESPEINSENLLILLAPLVLVYGVSLFYLLLDQLQLPFAELRYVVIGGFAALTSLPLLLAMLPPHTSPIAYPPYYPPSIQTAAGWATEEELTMSDVPWAVAWYGQTQCIWLTLNSYSDYFAINDYQKPVSALYLTSRTFDSWSRTVGWGAICVQCLLQLPKTDAYPVHVNLTLQPPSGAPTSFPLTYLQAGWPMQLLLTYRPHWPRPS